VAQNKDFKNSQESGLLLTTALQTATFSYDTVPFLYILRLNKNSKIMNTVLGLVSVQIE